MKTRLTEMLGIEHPIICGGMMRVGTAELAAAASNAGALGVMPALTSGSPEQLEKDIALAKSLTDKPFAVNLTVGVVATPINYDDLRPYYERAEREIGVSGDVAEQVYPNMGKDYFGKGYNYPMEKIPQSYLDQQLASELNGFSVPMPGQDEEIEMFVESTPQGRNSTPRPGYTPVGMVGEPETGQRCEGNSSCVPICPVQAKYNALKTLNAVRRDVNLEIRTHSVASQILVDRETGLIEGIKYKRYECDTSPNHTTETVTAKRYVLAANAIEVAKLLLALYVWKKC